MRRARRPHTLRHRRGQPEITEHRAQDARLQRVAGSLTALSGGIHYAPNEREQVARRGFGLDWRPGFEVPEKGQEGARDRLGDRVQVVVKLKSILLLVEQQGEARPGHLVGDGRLHDPTQAELRRCRLSRFLHRGDQQASLPRDQGCSQSLLARKILVDRADRDAGPLGHGIGRVTG